MARASRIRAGKAVSPSPKGVVHCYRCISAEPGFVINCPNQLFAGNGKQSPIDEIRHEDDPENPFVKDELARRLPGR